MLCKSEWHMVRDKERIGYTNGRQQMVFSGLAGLQIGLDHVYAWFCWFSFLIRLHHLGQKKNKDEIGIPVVATTKLFVKQKPIYRITRVEEYGALPTPLGKFWGSPEKSWRVYRDQARVKIVSSVNKVKTLYWMFNYVQLQNFKRLPLLLAFGFFRVQGAAEFISEKKKEGCETRLGPEGGGM